MALPDPYAHEPTKELNPDKVRLFKAARDAVAKWTAELERLKKELQAELDGAHAGTVDGVKVVTYRPQDRYAVARLVKDNPDITEHFWKHEVVRQFDVDTFTAQHPEIADAYRIRAFNEVT